MITYEEMNVYLASIGGLNRTYREDKGPILDSKAFGVGQGWLHLIKDMIEELIVLGWDKRLLQCKEKFGGLRVYWDEPDEWEHLEDETQQDKVDLVNCLIDIANWLCQKICMVCGEKGTLYNENWVTVLCEEHYNEQQEQVKGQ